MSLKAAFKVALYSQYSQLYLTPHGNTSHVVEDYFLQLPYSHNIWINHGQISHVFEGYFL